jgi:hypothetical protein
LAHRSGGSPGAAHRLRLPSAHTLDGPEVYATGSVHIESLQLADAILHIAALTVDVFVEPLRALLHITPPLILKTESQVEFDGGFVGILIERLVKY